jgi:hypothetical protein
MVYSSQEDYKTKMENSGTFRKANNYEVFGFNICMECKFFKADPGLPIHGECHLMEESNCYNGVVYDAVCNRYQNKRGFDLNGRVVDPVALPKWIPTRIDKQTGESFIAS